MITPQVFARIGLLILLCTFSYANKSLHNVTIPSFEIIIIRTKNVHNKSKHHIDRAEFLTLIEQHVTDIVENELSEKDETGKLKELSLFYDSSSKRRELTERETLMNITKLIEATVNKLNDTNSNITTSTKDQQTVMEKEGERLSIIKAKDTKQRKYKFKGYMTVKSDISLSSTFISSMLSNAFYDNNLAQVIKLELFLKYNISNIISISYQTAKTAREEYVESMHKIAIESENVMVTVSFLVTGLVVGGGIAFGLTYGFYKKLKSGKSSQGRIGIGTNDAICDLSTAKVNNCFDLNNVSVSSDSSYMSSSSSSSSL